MLDLIVFSNFKWKTIPRRFPIMLQTLCNDFSRVAGNIFYSINAKLHENSNKRFQSWMNKRTTPWNIKMERAPHNHNTTAAAAHIRHQHKTTHTGNPYANIPKTTVIQLQMSHERKTVIIIINQNENLRNCFRTNQFESEK